MPNDARKKPEELEAELAKIYTDGDGQLPDFTRLDGKPSSRLKSFLIGAALSVAAIAAVAWGGFFFFSRTSGFSGENVEIRMDSGEGLTAGEEAELVVRYANKERIPLAAAALAVEAPDGFEIASSEPPPDGRGEWPIGALAPGGEGEIRLKGLVRRELGATLTFRAKLRYKPADFNAEFEKIASHTAVVKTSSIALKGSGPEEMTPGDPIELAYEYENLTDRKLEALRFTIDPLDGFIFASAEPAADADVKGRWTIPSLEPKAKGTIKVRGTFTAASRGPKQLHARMGQTRGDDFYVYAEADAGTNVLKSDLAVALVANGSNQPIDASFGDTLYFTLNYENAGDVALRDVTISAALPSDPAGVELIDWVTLKDELEGKRTGSTVAWNKAQVEGLAQLKPGDKGAISFSVQLAKKPAGATAGSFTVNARASAKIAKTAKAAEREIATDPLPIRLLSDASFKTFARYFNDEGVPLGSGPLPPKVGEKTVYRIEWVVQNSLHELSDLSVSTVLPQGVKWTGTERQIDAGALTFDETGRKATWRLNKLPTSVQTVTIGFDVELTPAFEDIGKIVDLTGESRFEALDKVTNSVILKTASPVGTDLSGDEFASGKGVVKE